MGVKEVAAGAEWLDENFPGWEREIDLGTLDLSDCQACVCGQSLAKLVDGVIESGYHAAVSLATGEDNPFWGSHASFERALEWAQAHGFAIEGETSGESANAQFLALEIVWRELIKERFNTGNLSDIQL